MTEQPVSENLWKEWNSSGFIPGPSETELEFVARVAFCQNLEQHLFQQTTVSLPFQPADEAPQDIMKEALTKTNDLYGVAPKWVPLFFSNYQLTPWHGGCAWIFQLDEHTPTAAFLQVRARFRHVPVYLGLYRREELIAHELAHVGRMLYQEPQFEEFLAYQSSASPWRRWLGPIIQSSKESLFFILLLGLVILMDLALLSIGPGTETLSLYIKLIPFLIIALAFIRCSYRHSLLTHCLHRLEALYPPKIAKHFLYRLRDSEIKRFAKISPLQIHDEIETLAKHSFRWLFLKTLYPPLKIENKNRLNKSFN